MHLIELSFDKLREMLEEAAQIGALKALKQSGINVNDEISQREAYRRFGEANVKRWIHLRMIKKVKLNERNSKVTYSLQELTSIQSTLYVSTNRKPAKPKNHGTKKSNPNS
jgi:hypothetical protein